MAKRTGYQSSLAGLVGALVLCLLFIGGLVALQKVTSLDSVERPESFDYVPVVAQFQDQGLEVLYPASVPAGWQATSIDNVPGDRPRFGLGFLTREDADTAFVGYKWADLSASSLAASAMGDDVTEGETVTLDTPAFGTEWTEWTHKGDTGWSTEYPAQDGRTLLVWGSAPRKEMVDFINTLTTEKLPVSTN